MSPDKRDRRQRREIRNQAKAAAVVVRLSSDLAHRPVYFRRSDGSHPARDFIKSVPKSVQGKLLAIIAAVAVAPPKRFAGGGHWEAMHGDMTGWFEVRTDGPSRAHYRLFCLLDYEVPPGETQPRLVIVTGLKKGFRAKFSGAQYASVKVLGEEYWRTRAVD